MDETIPHTAGPHNSPESREAFARLQLEINTSPAATVRDPQGLSVAELLAAYADHCAWYYVDPKGKPT